MSMRCSLSYWTLGRVALHRYVHAAQPWNEKRVVFWEITHPWGNLQLWPWSMTYDRNPWWSR